MIEFYNQTLKAMEVGKKGKVHCEDIVFLIRKDPKKYARVKVCFNELLVMKFIFQIVILITSIRFLRYNMHSETSFDTPLLQKCRGTGIQ